MSMINVTLVGNLVRPPEQASFASGRVKATMRVAVNFSARHTNVNSEEGGDATAYYQVEAWGKLAELALRYLGKGSQVGVAGRLIMEHWTDKDGHERLQPVVAATQISLPPKTDRVVSSSAFADEPVVQPVHRSDPEKRSLADEIPFDSGPVVKPLRPTGRTQASETNDSFRRYPEDDDDLFAGAKVVAVREQSSPYRVFRSHRRQ